MKKTGIVILTIALIAAICGSFYIVNDKSKRANQKEKVLTEVQRITTKDLDKNYPQTPREVVKLYNRIVKCYYVVGWGWGRMKAYAGWGLCQLLLIFLILKLQPRHLSTGN